jgi:H+/gluconate symporter-like permease
MSFLRTLLIATWILWGALLPIVGGMYVATQLNFDLGTGALVGGLIALPLAMWGMRLADREVAREAPPSGPLCSDEKHVRSIALRDQLIQIAIALGILGFGLAGLIRGQTLIVLPSSGHHAAPRWVIDGPGGIVAAIGMILFGLGLLVYRGRETARELWDRGLLLAGLAAFALGHAIYGLGLLVARLNG